MRATFRRLLQPAITVALLVVLALYAREVQWQATWAVIRSASWSLLVLAMLANFVTLAAKGLTWWIFLRAVGAGSLALSVRATVAGAALNNVLIANSGDAARVVLVTRATGVRSAAVLAATALERLFDLIGYLVLLVTTAFLLPMPQAIERWRDAGLIALGIVALALLATARRATRIPTSSPVSARGLLRRWRDYLDRVRTSAGEIVTPERMALAFALTLVNWGAQIVTYHLTAVATRFPIGVVGSITTLLTANVGFLVRATPGNVGVFQLVYAVTAEALGRSRSRAFGVALLLQALQNVPVTLLGLAVAPDLVLHWRQRAIRHDAASSSDPEMHADAPIGGTSWVRDDDPTRRAASGRGG